MVSWSSFARPGSTFLNYRKLLKTSLAKNVLQLHLRRMGGDGHSTMPMTPSRFQFNKFKDMIHFYVMLGLIPITAIIFFSNVFVGPAQLSKIPDNYVPKYWEYHRHPITRFIARYIHTSPQQEYEKALHYYYEENEKAQIRELESRIRDLMASRQDYQAYYFRPAVAKYHRISKEAADELKSIWGD